MRTTNEISMLSIGATGLDLADPADDLRGMTVVDRHHHRVGQVDDLIIDDQERRLRLLVVASGGLVGLGRSQRLVPVDAVVRVAEQVHLDVSHEQIHVTPSDPELGPAATYRQLCSSYGYLPFWQHGYVHPYLLRPRAS